MLSESEWQLVLQFYLSHDSRTNAIHAWRCGAHEHALFDERFGSSAGLQHVLDEKDWLDHATARYDLFTYGYIAGAPQASNWLALKDGMIATSSERSPMLIDHRGTSLLFTTQSALTVPGFPGRVVPLGPPMHLTHLSTKRVLRLCMSAAQIECTLPEYERYAGKAPVYRAGEAVTEWAAEALRWLAESLGSAFAVVSASGARVVNAGSPIDPLLAGALVGNNIIQLFTVYSTSRPSLTSLSRRLLTTHTTRALNGLILGNLPVQTPTTDPFRKYVPLDAKFETSINAWLPRFEFVVLTTEGDCVRQLLEYYEPPGSLNHAVTMTLQDRAPAALAQSFAQLHTCAVCLLTFSACGTMMHRTRIMPRGKAAASEVAWACRDKHIQPMQYRRQTAPEEYRTLDSSAFATRQESWQATLAQPGFVQRIQVAHSDDAASQTTNLSVECTGASFTDAQRFPRFTAEQASYVHHISNTLIPHVPKVLIARAFKYAYGGYHVVFRFKENCYSVHIQRCFEGTSLALAYTGTKVVRLKVRAGPPLERFPNMVESSMDAHCPIQVVLNPSDGTRGGFRHAGIPMRAAGLYLLYTDPYYLAYLPNVTCLGRAHMDAMTGLDAEGISKYAHSIIENRLKRGQAKKLKRAAHKFRQQYSLSRPNRVRITGSVLELQAPSTLGTEV
jgi:hypothetical protein